MTSSTSRIAQLDELCAAAKAVVWFDWSDNDADAVAAVERLRQAAAALESLAAREWADPSEYARRGPLYDALVCGATDEAKIDALITLLKELGLYDALDAVHKKLRETLHQRRINERVR